MRPRGASYYHLISSLEQLSRGCAVKPSAIGNATDVDTKQPLPKVTTPLWPHQKQSVARIAAGVADGRRGHADASNVGAGKTLTALATICELARWLDSQSLARNGVLVLVPTPALVKEWLLEISCHTSGFHCIEQRETGELFSLTYARKSPPIDANSLVISTLDRVSEHPFVRQAAWDFVVIDECLAVQNAAAKRCPSAWRQIEDSTCGVLMLSATFFRSKYASLFYMIRMLRSPLPRTMEWLPATIHEHIVCHIPETDRSWTMRGEAVPLGETVLKKYRACIEAFKRRQLNDPTEADGRRLNTELKAFLRERYEGRGCRGAANAYEPTSTMAQAFVKEAKRLLKEKRRPLIFADTQHEADHLLGVLRASNVKAYTWSELASRNVSGKDAKGGGGGVIVAVKSVEGQGINMQGHADAIVCRPTPGDHLEQMKGRIDRPGQTTKELKLVVLMAEHTIEEAMFANIRICGSFFREYIAPVASRYREKIDLEATLAAASARKLEKGIVQKVWHASREAAAASGTFAGSLVIAEATNAKQAGRTTDKGSGSRPGKSRRKVAHQEDRKDDDDDSDYEEPEKEEEEEEEEEEEPKYRPLNTVRVNKGDPVAVTQARAAAKDGKASLAVRRWLFKPKEEKEQAEKPRKRIKFAEFSDTTPPLVLTPKVLEEGIAHLSRVDPKLETLIARIGADAIATNVGKVQPPTQARLFHRILQGITFVMISVEAGNSFLRRLAIKVGVCLEMMTEEEREPIVQKALAEYAESGVTNVRDGDHLIHLLCSGGGYGSSAESEEILFTAGLVGALTNQCERIRVNGKMTDSGYPHLCGVTSPCGKRDDPRVFLALARRHAKHLRYGSEDKKTDEIVQPVSAGYSAPKASYIVQLVKDFHSGKLSGKKLAKASDREAMKMLCGIKGIGDWSAVEVMMHFAKRADLILYGDLTVRNFLNDLYDIGHKEESETLLQSAADFPDTSANRNLIDDLAERNNWSPYRSLVCLLMYILQEYDLVLL